MKAVYRFGHGAKEYDYRDVPEPVCGADDVIIEVKQAAICGSDLAGYYNGSPLGGISVTGHEFAGVICETGANVTEWKVGDRVVSDNTGGVCGKCHACTSGQFCECVERKLIGGGIDGAFAKYVRIPGDVLKIHKWALVRVPENVPFEYACIMDPICNAYKAVCQEARPMPGEHAVVFGPGPIGLLAAQFCYLSGCANVILVGLKEDKDMRADVATQMGVTDFLTSDEGDVVEQIRAICGPEGADYAIDCAGAPVVFKQAVECVRKHGTVVRLGASSSPFGYSLNDMTYKAINVKGHHAYDVTSWRNAMALLEKEKLVLDPLITHKLPLDEWEHGMELMQSREGIKILLKP